LASIDFSFWVKKQTGKFVVGSVRRCPKRIGRQELHSFGTFAHFNMLAAT
jgi:hypothetical protein